MTEYLRPWKLVTFSMGLGLLLVGSVVFPYSDWDIGVSIVMATFSYLKAPITVRTIMRRNWRKLPEAAFWTWFTVDGCYVIYHTTVGNEMLRAAQWPTSLCLYFLCGLIWLHDGPFRELLVRHKT